MGFKMTPPYKLNNVPIYEVPFSMDNAKEESDGLVAKANDNFTMIVNKNKVNDGPLMAKAMSHEGEHLRQMFGIGKYEYGDLKYNEAGVEYKGKFHDRNAPGFNEADKTLPYEAPAYAAGESLKPTDDLNPDNMKQPSFRLLGSKGDPDQESVNMNERFGGTAFSKERFSPAKFTLEGGPGDKVKTWKGVQGGKTGTYTQTTSSPEENPDWKVDKDTTPTKDPEGYLQNLINSGISREEVKARRLVSEDKYDLFEPSEPTTVTTFKADPTSSSTTTSKKKKEEIPPVKTFESEFKDFSYLDHADRSLPYKGAKKFWGGELLSGTNVEKTRPFTPDEMRYLGYTPETYGGTFEDYKHRKDPDYVGFWDRISNNTGDSDEGGQSLANVGLGGTTTTNVDTGIINDHGNLIK